MTSRDRKKHRKGKIFPNDVSDDKEVSLQDDSEKNSLNRTREKIKNAADKVLPLKALANARTYGNRWKSYITTRRQMSNAKDSDQDGNEARKTGGIGLELDNDTGFSSTDLQDGKPLKMTMRQEHNRNLIQYFARLAQAKKDDVQISLEYIEAQLESGANINCTDKYGQSILHEAARAWHVDVARFLLEKGANINLGDRYGRTPLHVAAAVDYPDMVTLLIKKKADKEGLTKGESQTPMHYAAKNDATMSMKALLKEGCDYKTVRDCKGRTPLHLAAELDRSETARLLLELDDPAPAGVEDNQGQSAIVWMIAKMPPVAKLALDQFHTTDRASRKQSFHLHQLEPRKPGMKTDAYPQTAGNHTNRNFSEFFPDLKLHMVCQCRNFDLITHPVITDLIRTKWQVFGKRGAVINLIVNALFILTWTLNAVLVEYDVRHRYDLPSQWYRIVLLVAAIVSTAWQLKEELTEYFQSKRIFNKWRVWRDKELKLDLKYAHPRWPEEEKYLKSEIGDLDVQRPQYFNDFWNIFDWVCYTLLLASIITHFIDVGYHTNLIARLHIRIMAITIILIWIRLLKNARAFAYLGPFIVILTHMTGDVVKFALLYLQFFVPFACAFWMMFGGDKTPERYQGLPNPTENTVEVEGMANWFDLTYSLFRLTLVDDYDYDGMKAVDSVMATLLCASWLALSAILMLNLFIALLSDTFQRVYDNAQANAIMQKAITIIAIEEGLSFVKRERFRAFIHSENNPKITFYDDDNAEPGERDLQKVTIQVKEQLDEIEANLHAGVYHMNGMREQQRRRNDSTSSDYRPGGHMDTGLGLDTDGVGKQVDMLKKQMDCIKKSQDDMKERYRKDMSSIKTLLRQIAASVNGSTTHHHSGADTMEMEAGSHFIHNNLLTDAHQMSTRAIEPVSAYSTMSSRPPVHPSSTLTRSLTMNSDPPTPIIRSQLNNTHDEEREQLERQRTLELDELRQQLQHHSDHANRDEVLSGSQLVVEVSDARTLPPAVLIRPSVLGTDPHSTQT